MAFRGRQMVFHGSFTSKADAIKKESQGKGRFIKKVDGPRGSVRYVVMSRKGK